ncbi:ribose 5-phosphate isomerase A [archaeon SCG-AAA382B04]|nr:ribose 5-phosphate isomerase A [archaeon SCG-AAA382B04]
MKVKKPGKDEFKKRVAEEACELIENEMVIGLGTGSTVGYLIEKIGEKINTQDLEVSAICSSYQTKERAIKNGIPLTSFEEIKKIDLTIDGADQVDKKANLIKGGGAAHFREKIIARYSEKFVCIVDETKTCEKLNNPVPVEVHPFAKKPVEKELQKIGAEVEIRKAQRKDGPIVTDNGNFILDCDFGTISDPSSLKQELNNFPGIIEHGLFINLAKTVFIANEEGIKSI